MGGHAPQQRRRDGAIARYLPKSGGIDERQYRIAADAERRSQGVPVNHSPVFAPVVQPTLVTGTQAVVVAALAWLTR